MSGTTSPLASAFNTNTFMQLLIAELKNQDPEAPTSQAEMTSQISSMAMVDGMNGLNASFSDVLKLQQLLSGEQMIGHEVQYRQGSQTLSGLVQAVAIANGSATLTVDGQSVPVDQVTKIL
jgi:flagellar basal-body rod modification protein FlgD